MDYRLISNNESGMSVDSRVYATRRKVKREAKANRRTADGAGVFSRFADVKGGGGGYD